MAWHNTDGLYLKYGNEKTVANKVGSYVTPGKLREIHIKNLALTSLTTTAAIISDVAVLPVGARIEEVEVVTVTLATTGTSAALNVGTIRQDRTTAIDVDGLVKAAAVTTMDAAGEKQVLRIGSTGVGDQVGTTTATYPALLTANTSTGTFTAGVVDVTIRYMVP